MCTVTKVAKACLSYPLLSCLLSSNPFFGQCNSCTDMIFKGNGK